MKEHTLLFNAIHELKIDVPVMKYEIKGDKVTLYLYGGQVVTWSPAPVIASETKQSPHPKPKPKAPPLPKPIPPSKIIID
jgi:hypothetical protein